MQMLRLPPYQARRYAACNLFQEKKPMNSSAKTYAQVDAAHAALVTELSPGRVPLRWVLASLSVSMLLSSIGTSIVNVGLPTLTAVFRASVQQAQWVVLAYLLAVTTLVVSVGRLGDLTGRRRLLLVGIALFMFASLLCGLAPSLELLIAARALQGLGAAIMMTLTMAFVGEALPQEKTGSAMGMLGTMSAVGTALGPTLGGVLIAWFGWPALFFINLPLGAVALLLACRFLPADRRDANAQRIRFDYAGTLLLALALAAYALAVTLGRGSFGLLNIALLVAALCSLGLFVLVQKRAVAPLIQLAMFDNVHLGAGFAMSALVTTVVMATLVVGPFYLSGALSLDAVYVGLVMSSGPLVAAVMGVPAGRMVDRFGAQRMTVAALLAMLVGCTALAALSTGYSVLGYIAPLTVVTAGYAVFQAANNTGVMTSIQPHERGVVSGLLNLSRNLGLVTGAAVMGAVFVYATGVSDVMTAHFDAVAAGMRSTFAVAAALVAVALAIAAIASATAEIRR
jgi:EmrB/QacA subfamily drug resistance transporter